MRLRGVSAAVLASFFVVSLAPVATAQSLPDTSDLGDTVGDTTGGITDAAGDTTGGTTDTVTDTVDDTTGTVTDTTDTVTDTVDETTGGSTGGVTDTVDDTTDTVGGTTGGVTDTVDDTTDGGGGSGGDVTDPVTDTVKDATGGLSSESPSTGTVIDDFLGGSGSGSGSPSLSQLTPDLLDDLVEEAAARGLSPAAAEGWIDGKKDLGAAAYRDPLAVLGALTRLLTDFAGDLGDRGLASGSADVSYTTGASGSSFFDSAGRAAVTAAKALAFPLALGLLVVGFLAVQGRIGRKDPKLVLAPVDTIQDTLTFE